MTETLSAAAAQILTTATATSATASTAHPRYAELHAHSAFSFLDGASQPEELVAEAARLGLGALALTDHDGLYGVVRFSQAAKKVGLPTVIGAELSLSQRTATTGVPDPDAIHLPVLARGPEGYARLSRALATAHLATGHKGERDYGRGVGLDPLEVLAEQAGGETADIGSSSPGAARGRCAAPSNQPRAATTSMRPTASWTASSPCSAGATSPSKSPIMAAPRMPNAARSWSTSPTAPACPRSLPGTSTPPPRAMRTSPMSSLRSGPGQAWTSSTRGCRPLPPICAVPLRCCSGIAVTRTWSRPPRAWEPNAPSTSPSSPPTCRRSRCPMATPRPAGYGR